MAPRHPLQALAAVSVACLLLVGVPTPCVADAPHPAGVPTRAAGWGGGAPGDTIELTIEGAVAAGTSGEPVGSAVVSVHPLHGDSALARDTTSPEGRYRIPLVMPWEEVRAYLRVEVRAPGFERHRVAVRIDSTGVHRDVELEEEPSQPEPIRISSVDQLRRIGRSGRYPLDGDYVLTGDIDASQTAGWNEGRGFLPIGKEGPRVAPTDNRAFSGTFDGRGHAISGLTIHRPEAKVTGLFAILAGATVEDLMLRDLSITGDAWVGGLAGAVFELSTIRSSRVEGEVGGNSVVGVLVGEIHRSEIHGSETAGSVTETPKEMPGVSNGTGIYFGGLAGRSQFALIEGSSADVEIRDDIEAPGSSEDDFTHFMKHSGGLVGDNRLGQIRRSRASGDIHVRGRVAGGLAGLNSGQIVASAATGDVWVSNTSAGGLVGDNGMSTTRPPDGPGAQRALASVRRSYATGRATGAWRVGGLAGTNSSSRIVNSYATGSVSYNEAETGTIGGLVGSNRGEISRSFATGHVSSTTENEAEGGLVGSNEGTTGNVDETGEGGDALLTASYWDVRASGHDRAAGDDDVASEPGAVAGNDDYARGLDTREMRGAAAREHMEWLDFEEVWRTVPDGYPRLRWQRAGAGPRNGEGEGSGR